MDGAVYHEKHKCLEGPGPAEEEVHPDGPSTRLAQVSWGFHHEFRTTFSISLSGIWAISVWTTSTCLRLFQHRTWLLQPVGTGFHYMSVHKVCYQ